MSLVEPPTLWTSWLDGPLHPLCRRGIKLAHEVGHLVMAPDHLLYDPHWGLGLPSLRGPSKEQWLAGEAAVFDIQFVVESWWTLGRAKPDRIDRNRENSWGWFSIKASDADPLIADSLQRFPDIDAIWAEVQRKKALARGDGRHLPGDPTMFREAEGLPGSAAF